MICARDTIIPKSWTTSKHLKDQLDPPVGDKSVTKNDHFLKGPVFVTLRLDQLDPPVGDKKCKKQ